MASPTLFFFSFSSPLSLTLLYCLSLSVFRSKTRGDPSLRWCWRGSAARRGRKRRREEDRPLLQSSERRFFFLPAREPKPSEAKEKFRKQKASFGAHAHRHLCAPARLYLYRSPSPRVKGLAGSSARGRREQLSDGRERESARPEKTVSLFAPKARGEKRNQIFPMGETREGETPRVLPLSSPPASLSLSTVLAHLGVHAAQEVIKLLDGGAPVWALAVRRDPGERLRRAPAARAVLPRGGIVVLSRGVVGVLEPQIVGEELLLGRARRQAQRDDGLRHAGAKGKTKRENRGRDQILFFLLFFFFFSRGT